MKEKISIVTSLYKSAAFLPKFIEITLSALKQIQCDEFEIIFVNDGSPDDSLKYLLEEKTHIPQITIIDLSRNFGHHYALMAGMKYSSGDLVFLIDCDLEVSPNELIMFYKTFKEKGNCDVIYGVQEKRKGNLKERILGNFFYRTFNYLSETKIHANQLTERLMNRRYIDELLKLGDKNIFLAGMMQWVGFNQFPVFISKALRNGNSTYTFKKKLSLFIQATTSFSSFPLIILFNFGLIITTLSMITGIYFVVRKLMYPEMILLGYSSIIILLLILLGIIITSIGVLGLYINKIFNQSKNRQTFIIKDIYK